MTQLDDFLAQQGVTLSHKAVEGGGSSKKFDEGRVKRDGRGQFAKKASDTINIDALWESLSLKDLELALVMGNKDKIESLIKSLAKKHGVSPDKFMVENEDLYRDSLLDIINNPKNEYVVSPSGTQRVKAFMGKDQQLELKRVPYDGPNPHPEVTERLMRETREMERKKAAGDTGGMTFNPKARPDTSQVEYRRETDFGSSVSSAAKKVKSWWQNNGLWQDDMGEEVEQVSNVEDFLAHYGVKGMRWGVRRSDAQLSKSGGLRSRFKRKGKSEDDDSDAGEGGSSGGKSDLSKKDIKTAEAAKDVHVSVDAERFIKTRQKEGYEMSDREIREALNRAKMVKEYDELFGGGKTGELKQKVEALRLQKEYAQMQAEMNPTRVQRVARFTKTASDAFDSYQKINKATGGALGKTVNGGMTALFTGKPGSLGGSYVPKHKAAKP